MVKKVESLSNKLSKILTTAPIDNDSDNEDETRAQVVEMDDNENEDTEHSLRRFQSSVLEDLGEKYIGKSISRADLDSSDLDSEISGDETKNADNRDESEENDTDNNVPVEVSDEDIKSLQDNETDIESLNTDDEDVRPKSIKSISSTSKNSKMTDESDNEDDTDDENDDIDGGDGSIDDDEEGSEEDNDSEEGEDLEDYEEDEDDHTYKNLNTSSNHVKKGECVRNQLQIWENLLEMRIQLQKTIVNSNKLPEPQLFESFAKNSKEFVETAAKSKKTLADTLGKLVELQQLLLSKFGETKTLLKSKGVKRSADDNDEKNDGSDEEIPSDTEDEGVKSGEESEEENKDQPEKKRKIEDFNKTINEIHNKYKPYRRSVINKWNEKTRLITGKGAAANNPVTDQIEHILSDKARLIRRSQLKKSQYKVIGERNEENDKKSTDDSLENQIPRYREEHNSEIYDDDDFYHQLLRELIEVKSADITDPVQLGRQWVQLQNLRSKMKRKVDTKCTKGRKIRYTVHTKLINFMAPIDFSSWTDEARTELAGSVCGKFK